MNLTEVTTPDRSADTAELRCFDCGKSLPIDSRSVTCDRCGGLLDVSMTWPSRVDPSSFGDTPAEIESGVWRYRSMLPPIADSSIVTRGEGRTPMYRDERLSEYVGVVSLGLKHEGQNPTASFKDRGMTVGVSHAVEIGATMVACASTGNTSASLASYAAAAEIPALVIIPDGKISAGKLAQTIAYGARIVQIEGDFDAALSLLRQLTDAHPVYLVNSVNPFRLEGQKTIVIEMFEQLDWNVPDVVALPGGNLGNTAAFGRALDDMLSAGLIDRVPRLVTVQADGAAPFANYFESGFDHYEPVEADTVATAIKIGNPASVERARRAIERTDGISISVSDEQILESKSEIDRCGIGCEPASAASVAGIRKLAAEGQIDREETVVAVLTGHVLKDADAIVDYHTNPPDNSHRLNVNTPVSIPADFSVLERTLADALHS